MTISTFCMCFLFGVNIIYIPILALAVYKSVELFFKKSIYVFIFLYMLYYI